jgi:hypothetical protein
LTAGTQVTVQSGLVNITLLAGFSAEQAYFFFH